MMTSPSSTTRRRCTKTRKLNAKMPTLERGTAKYPIRRVVCKSFTVPQNYLDVSHEKLFSGQLPTRIVIGLVSNRAFNGHLTSNFQHFGLNEIALYLDGQQQHAVRHIQPNYEMEQYIRAYDSLFAGTGRVCLLVAKTTATDTRCMRST